MKKFSLKKEISLDTKILNAKNQIIKDNIKAKKLAEFINSSKAFNPTYDGVHFNDGAKLSTILPVNTFYYSILNNMFYNYIDKADTKGVKIKKVAKAMLCAPLMAVGAISAIVLEVGLYIPEAIGAIFKAPKFLVRKLAYKRVQNAKTKLESLKTKINKNAYFIECNEKETLPKVTKEFIDRINAKSQLEKLKNRRVPQETSLQVLSSNLPALEM